MRKFLIVAALMMATSCTKCSRLSLGTGIFGRDDVKKAIATQKLTTIDDITGTGDVAEPGKKVTLHYAGYLTSGKKFDNSYDRKTPYSFVLGAGTVIKGWDEGVQGMKVGGKRILAIPSELAYGNRAVGSLIPENSPLIFEIELLKVE